MKKILVSVFALFIAFVSFSQTYDVREKVMSDRYKASGCEGPYRFDAEPQTPSPKGYEPFYISHYGRHGSRYMWKSSTYTVIKQVLDAAKRSNSLTEAGERLYRAYSDFFLIPYVNTGDLSELGAEQHTAIAAQMCAEFPEVFAKGGRVVARASVSPRAITSMSAFCVSLQKNAPEVDIEVNSLHSNLVVVYPVEAPEELQQKFVNNPELPSRNALEYLRARHYDDITGRLFSDRGFLEDMGGRSSFVTELFNLWAGYHNYCGLDFLEGLFTPEEIADFWEVENLSCYISHAGDRYRNIPLLMDVIQYADEAIRGGSVKCHLRFGHDTVVNAFIPLLNLNGSGFMPDKAEDVKYWFQTYNCPKAANVQFILYRSKKSQDILFKVLLNNSEASLPQLTPVSGPYYKWSDFKNWAESVRAAHTENLNLQSWMKALPDDMPACQVSIPGSHDAATATIPLDNPAREFVGTQTFPLGEQFLKGVRCYDLRPGFPGNDTTELRIMHNVVDAGVSAAEAFGAISLMLKKNPSEFAVIVVRIENNDFTPEILAAAERRLSSIEKQYADAGMAIDFRPGLTVGDVRGKMLIINRNDLRGRFWCGARATDWDEGAFIFGKDGAKVAIDVQDEYEWEDDDTFASGKTSAFATHSAAFAASGAVGAERWSVNHVSGYFDRNGKPRPHEFALGAAPAIRDWLASGEVKGSLGIVLIDYAGDPDYAGDELVSMVVGRNFK